MALVWSQMKSGMPHQSLREADIRATDALSRILLPPLDRHDDVSGPAQALS